MALTAPPANPRINPALTVRPLQAPSEWDAMVRQQNDIDREDFAYPDDNGLFRANQMTAAQRMVDDGHGHWWGAFLGDVLVGGMGLFFDEARTIGRFQYVTTAARYRRQRVCSTLLDQAVRHAFTAVRPDVLVISTDADDKNPAIPTYRNFGFKDAMRSYAFRKVPRPTAP